MNPSFWRGKRVLVTGHTGFKGGWLCLWLKKMGAIVAGYALPAERSGSLFALASVAEGMDSVCGDIGSLEKLRTLFDQFRPDVVFHLAAQALVRSAYHAPAETYRVNVMGTVQLLEAVRESESCNVVVIITSDKCYENKEWVWGYRESDPMGGYDPYSSSKGCAELITAAYRNSFFGQEFGRPVGVASARAGNVIGGGDFSRDRIVPDLVAAARKQRPLNVRSPDAVRPWQHVLEPLSGYLLLAEKLWEDPVTYAQGWNFGPDPNDVRSVRWIVERFHSYWGASIPWDLEKKDKPHEAHLLTLDSAKARMMLGWKPRWSLEIALRAAVDWYKAHENGEALRDVIIQQITTYEAAAER